jgi:hypothetical protein
VSENIIAIITCFGFYNGILVIITRITEKTLNVLKLRISVH